MKRNKKCEHCGKLYRNDLPEPIHCPCGFLIGQRVSSTAEPLPQSSTRKEKQEPRRRRLEVTEIGKQKAAICRANCCGHYDAEHDACGILYARGKAGRVSYLLTHPETRCVADEPLF